MNTKNTPVASEAPFDPGEQIFEWSAFDYHPHHRGWIWFLVFCVVVLGVAVLAILDDMRSETSDWGWLPAFTIFLAVSVYFWSHRKGHEMQRVRGCKNGFFIGERFIPRERIEGFWFVYDKTVSVINLQLRSKRGNEKIMLQMGNQSPEFFRKNMEMLEYTELTDKKESLTDLWIRALKL